MHLIISLIKIAAVLFAAGVLGSWFVQELKGSKIRDDPWYKPYTSLPGIIIILAVLLPILVWVAQQ